jgi:hypothetical protein
MKLNREVFLIGGYPKGYSEPFSQETLSGKRLHAMMHDLKFYPTLLDLWRTREEESTMDISPGTAKMLCWYLSGDYPNEVRVGALGDWVFKALVRSGKRYPLIGIRIKDGTIRRLPHPAARRIADHKKLRRQLLNLKEWWALPALLAEVE